jgi:hypothetical protein
LSETARCTTNIKDTNGCSSNCWEFAKNIRSLTTKRVAMVNLNVALMIFERTYEKVGNVMPAFVKLCSEPEDSSAPSFPG